MWWNHGVLNLPWFKWIFGSLFKSKHFTLCADWNKGFSDYEAKRRKLTEAISLRYTVKRGVTLRSTAEWEKENTPTHTHRHTEGIQQTLPKKGQKGQKKNKNKVNTVKNLKRGHNAFTSKFKKTSLLARRTGKERKIIMIIQQTSMWCKGAIVFVSALSKSEQR